MEGFPDRLARVREMLSLAAESAGRPVSDISIMGVTKTRSLQEILAAASIGGLTLFGENRIQEALPKISSWPEDLPVEWHLIGHLQKNKARKALLNFTMIQSLDSIELADILERISLEIGRQGVPVLLEVNTSGESSKYGVKPEDASYIASYICENCRNLSLQGLMTVGPLTEDEKQIRSAFGLLRGLLVSIGKDLNKTLPVLSMGMSYDFHWAVEEGSTMVRIGSALFGTREYN